LALALSFRSARSCVGTSWPRAANARHATVPGPALSIAAVPIPAFSGAAVPSSALSGAAVAIAAFPGAAIYDFAVYCPALCRAAISALERARRERAAFCRAVSRRGDTRGRRQRQLHSAVKRLSHFKIDDGGFCLRHFLFDLDFCARVFELLLDLLGFVFGDAFLYRLGRTFDERLSFSQAEVS
jgi:hypothetical protein